MALGGGRTPTGHVAKTYGAGISIGRPMSIPPPRDRLGQAHRGQARAVIPPRPPVLATDARCEPHQKPAPYECYRCGRFCCGFCFESMARDSICDGCEQLLLNDATPTPRQEWLSTLAMGFGGWRSLGLLIGLSMLERVSRGLLGPRYARVIVGTIFGLGPLLWVGVLAALVLPDASPPVRRALRKRFLTGAGLGAVCLVLGLVMVFH